MWHIVHTTLDRFSVVGLFSPFSASSMGYACPGALGEWQYGVSQAGVDTGAAGRGGPQVVHFRALELRDLTVVRARVSRRPDYRRRDHKKGCQTRGIQDGDILDPTGSSSQPSASIRLPTICFRLLNSYWIYPISYKSSTCLFPIMHPNTQAVPYICIVAVRVCAPASQTTMTSVRLSDRVLGATEDNCLLSLVSVDSYIAFTAVRMPWVLKVIVDDTRIQFTLLEGYRYEDYLRSRSSSSCTLSSLSTVETHGQNG